MKHTLRIIAVLIALAATGYWFAAGANRGWSKTSVPQKVVDEVTGIEGITYQKKFVPGVDFVAVGLAVAVVPVGVSFLFRSRKHQSQKPNKTEI